MFLSQKHFGDADKYLIYEWVNNGIWPITFTFGLPALLKYFESLTGLDFVRFS
jgi:hypothetical protein